jgi:mannose/cellobiose epimerase-like protein (N-acyl-D-glucosamine 2-epimerase family)
VTTAPVTAAPASAPAQLVQAASRFRDWTIREALPLWASAGRDARTGAFHERLLLDGAPDLAAPRRTRVQARQIYVYAHADLLGWFPGGAALALAAFDRLVSDAGQPGKPGLAHLLNPDRSIGDDRRDAYDHAFFLLAFGWLWKATGEAGAKARVKARLDQTLADVDALFGMPDGTLREDDRDSAPRRQNPHMHMFEALLALHRLGAAPDALARADRILDRSLAHFIDAGTGLIGEFFDADLRLLPDARGRIIEPGHLCEWVWLLGQRAALPGASPSLRAIGGKLLANARALADPATGFMIDEADRGGAVLRSTRRLWPQTELIKALLARAEQGDGQATDQAADQAADVIARFMDHYLIPAHPGGWLDQFDAGGVPLAANMPASSFYHVFVAVAEADRVSRIV